MDTVKMWDKYIKWLTKKEPQALVSFLMPTAVFDRVVDRELEIPSLRADGLYQVIWREEKVMLHVEFQKRRDANMGRRMWLYNALTNMHTELPVYSVVIYMQEDKPLVESPYVITLPDGRPTQRLDFETIKLWEIPSEVFEQEELLGLLPLVPLTKDGKDHGKIRRMMGTLKEKGEKELLAFSYVFSSFVLTDDKGLELLKESFTEMHDLISHTWVFQEILQEGVEKGKKEGLEEGLEEGKKEEFLQFVEIRFPTLLAQVKRVLEQQMSVEQLRTLFNKLYQANTIEEARSALQAHDMGQ